MNGEKTKVGVELPREDERLDWSAQTSIARRLTRIFTKVLSFVLQTKV